MIFILGYILFCEREVAEIWEFGVDVVLDTEGGGKVYFGGVSFGGAVEVEGHTVGEYEGEEFLAGELTDF